ncbi:MAG: helix-turn-helix transcriptional regulator [Nanobdellota archaeon]
MKDKLKFIKNNNFVTLWLIIGLITGFAAVIFFSLTYLNQKILCNVGCRVKNEISLILILLSLFGMFIGSLTYYFISEKYEKKITRLHKDLNLTLKFLEGEEKYIMRCIIEDKGKTTQSRIVKKTGLSRVKVSRGINKLCRKGAILKSREGMTNSVIIENNLNKVLID